MAVDFLTIVSGSNVGCHYFQARSDLPVTLVVPASCNPAELRIQCAVSSGAAQANDFYGEIQIQQQPGAIFSSPFTVTSVGVIGTRQVFVGPLGPFPTPFWRLFLAGGAGAAATMTNTYVVITARFAT